MSNTKRVAVTEGLFGAVGLYALMQEVTVRWHEGTYDAVDLWSHFTYQSNLIAVIALLASTFAFWIGVTRETEKYLDYVRGAATLYMIITGVVYALLVNNADPAVMVDHYIMHYIMPLAMVVCWLAHPPVERLDYSKAVLWLAYPLCYVAYVQIEGRVTGDYFYEFLNPTEGVLPVIATIGGLLFASAGITWVMSRMSAPATSDS